MNRNIRMGVSAGGPTIITIFVVLSLTTLGTLALTTAQADLRLTEKTAAYEMEYYLTDSLGEEFLAQVDEILAEPSPSQALEALADTEVLTQPDGSMLLTHRIPQSDNQLLLIQLQIPSLSQQAALPPYRILTWMVRNTNYWNYEEYQVTIDSAMQQ